MDLLQVKLENLYNECIKEVEDANIKHGYIYDLRIETKKTRVFGNCMKQGKLYTISISRDLLSHGDDKGIKDTIIHEILHTCNGCMNHGTEWKYYANIMNYKYGYNIKRTGTMEECGYDEEIIKEKKLQRESKYKYILKCENCDNEIKFMRKCDSVNNPYLYRCASCHSKFKLITL